MEKFTNPLDNIKIAAPCSAEWDEMVGDERQRHCGACKLNVYNLSGMSRTEAENLILQTEGRLCVRFYRRADGTVLTDECPVGLEALRKRVSRAATAFASIVFTGLSGIGLTSYFSKSTKLPNIEAIPLVENLQTEKPLTEKQLPVTPIKPDESLVMGKMMIDGSENYPVTGAFVNVREIRGQIQKKRRR